MNSGPAKHKITAGRLPNIAAAKVVRPAVGEGASLT